MINKNIRAYHSLAYSWQVVDPTQTDNPSIGGYLTDNGSILIPLADEKWCFIDARGNVRREVLPQEADYLIHEIGLPQMVIQFKRQPEIVLPQWKYLGCYLSIEDNTNYKCETSNNGGNYAEWENEHLFYDPITNKFISLTTKHSSYEGDYDQTNGQYQSRICWMYATNTDNLFNMSISGSENEDVVLEQMPNTTSPFHIYNLEQYLREQVVKYYGSQYEDDDDDKEYGLEEKKIQELVFKAISFGYKIQEHATSRRR